MPTVGTQPSLKRTQAVAAVLLHQFATERFREARENANLVRQAEEQEELREQLNDLASVLMSDEDDCNTTITNNNNNHNETTTATPVTSSNNNSDHDKSDDDMSIVNATSTTTNTTSSPNSTLNGMEEQFHSMAESSLNGGDRTMYHSMTTNQNQSTSGPSSTTLDQLQSSPCLAAYGRELRRMAEEFERSRLRQDVKRRAQEVNLSELTKDGFVQLLEELFQGDGGTREKIVTLFFFSTDVALRAADFAQVLVVKLMSWSFSYIINTVCSIIHKLGGWDKVLFYQLPSLLISCCAVLAICSMVVFLKRSLHSAAAT